MYCIRSDLHLKNGDVSFRKLRIHLNIYLILFSFIFPLGLHGPGGPGAQAVR